MSYAVALTGGIGSGKSTAAAIFASLGAEVIDTDALAAELTAPGGRAIDAIRAAFGSGALAPDGSLDRGRMRGRALGDAGAGALMEKILYPLVLEACERRIRESSAPYVLLVAPSIAEEGRRRLGLNRVVAVACAVDLRVARVAARSGLAESQVRGLVEAKAAREARRAAADDTIDNSGPIDSLRAQVESLHTRYLGLAAAKRVTSRDAT